MDGGFWVWLLKPLRLDTQGQDDDRDRREGGLHVRASARREQKLCEDGALAGALEPPSSLRRDLCLPLFPGSSKGNTESCFIM